MIERQQPIRVCFVMPVGDRLGGAEKMLWLFLQRVNRKEVLPEVVFLQDGPFRVECGEMGFRTSLVSSGRLRDVVAGTRTVWSLASLFRNRRPDLIVEWFGKSHPWVAPAAVAAGLGSRVVWWQHSVPEGDMLTRLITLLPVRAVGAESRAAADAQAAMWPHRRTFVVHSGIEDESPADPEGLRRAAREELGVASDEILVGMIARVQRWKGQHHLLEALAVLRARGVCCRGVIVGGDVYDMDPGYSREIATLRCTLGLEGSVALTGQVRDPRAYLLALDVFVNVSVRENLSLALLEAMAASRCIVGVADGGTPEAVQDGRSGLLIERSDSVLLADALARVVVSAGLREHLGSGARQAYEAGFTAEGWTQALENRIDVLARPAYAEELAVLSRRPR